MANGLVNLDSMARAMHRLHDAQLASMITAATLLAADGTTSIHDATELLIAAQVIYVAAVDAAFAALLLLPGLSDGVRIAVSSAHAALLPAQQMLSIAQGNISPDHSVGPL